MRAGVSTEPRRQESGAELTSVSGAVSEWKMQSRAATTTVMSLIGRSVGLWLLGNVRALILWGHDSVGINAENISMWL